MASYSIPVSSTAGRSRYSAFDVDASGNTAALANNKVIALYDLSTFDRNPISDEVACRFSHHSDQAVNPVRWNPHHTRRAHLACTSRDNQIVIWNTEDRPRPVARLSKHTDVVADICWCPLEETQLATASNSSSIYIWDLRTAKKPVHGFKATSADKILLAYNRVGSHLLAAAVSNQICVWDTRKAGRTTGGAPVLLFAAHASLVTSLDWSYTSEDELLTGGVDEFVRLWKIKAGTEDAFSSKVAVDSASEAGARSGVGRSSAQLESAIGREQPVQKVMFAPFGQAAVTSSRGLHELQHASQTLQLWALTNPQGLAGRREFVKVNAFEAGMSRILESRWRSKGDGSFQLMSLAEERLCVHSISPEHQQACGDTPVGASPSGREADTSSGSEFLESLSRIKLSDLMDDLVPVVTNMSSLQNGAAARRAGDTHVRELVEVESLAEKGVFGDVSGIAVDSSRRSMTLVLHARSEAPSERPVSSVSRANSARKVDGDLPGRYEESGGGDDDHGARQGYGQGDSTKQESQQLEYVASAKLRVRVTVPHGYLSGGEIPVIRLESAGGSTRVVGPGTIATGDDPLDAGTLVQLQAAAKKAMMKALDARTHSLEASLTRLRWDLDNRVRDVALQAAGTFSLKIGDPRQSQQHGTRTQFAIEGERQTMLSKVAKVWESNNRTQDTDAAVALHDEGKAGIVPCPRRFGASFAASGTLVVFASALRALRARADSESEMGSSDADGVDWRRRRQNKKVYPRTYEDLVDGLLRTRHVGEADWREDGDDEQAFGTGVEGILPRDPLSTWTRNPISSTAVWCSNEYDDDSTDVEDDEVDSCRRHSESWASSSGEESKRLVPYETKSRDNARLPISHPEHSLEPDLGDVSSDAGLHGDQNEDDDAGTDGDDSEDTAVPWTPKPHQVLLLDFTLILPGSRDLAAAYKLGPWRPEVSIQISSGPATTSLTPPRSESLSGMPDNLAEGELEAPSSSSNLSRPRRNTLLIASSPGMASAVLPAPLALQRNVSLGGDSVCRTTPSSKRVTPDPPLQQIIPPALGRQRKWDSTPDFKAVRGLARNAMQGSRTGWEVPASNTSSAFTHLSSPFGTGSPGRLDMSRAMHRAGQRSGSIDELVSGSPRQQHTLTGLADVVELPLRTTTVAHTPPRTTGWPEGVVISSALAGSGDEVSPGTSLSGKYSSEHRAGWRRMRSAPSGMRQNLPARKNLSPGGGPSPPSDMTPRQRTGLLYGSTMAGIHGPLSASPPLDDGGSDNRGIGILFGGSGAVCRTSSTPRMIQSSLYTSLTGEATLATAGNRSRSGTGYSNTATALSWNESDSCNDVATMWGGPCIAELCRQNAAVRDASRGTRERQRAWALLAGAADREALENDLDTARALRMSSCNQDSGKQYRGARPTRGKKDALRILRHFEAQGDVQMLACIACVAGHAGGIDCHSAHCSGLTEEEVSALGMEASLLPLGEDDMATYDRYLTAYARILDSWGDLETKAEVLKHRRCCEQTDQSSETGSGSLSRADLERFEAVDHGEAHAGHGHVRCSVCHLGVVGEVLFCERCEHGGHANHLKIWFRNTSVCPQMDCDCRCRATNVDTR